MSTMLTEFEAAKRLACSVGLLRKWRASGIGPVFCRFGRLIRYPVDAVDAFIAKTRVDPNGGE